MTLSEIDMPTDYIMIFTALTAVIGSLLLPWWVIQYVVVEIAGIIILDKDNASFFVNKFIPELQKSSSQIVLSSEDSLSIQHKFEGMLSKILYAFLWQEHYIPDYYITESLWEINLGAKLMPVFNLFSSSLSQFP